MRISISIWLNVVKIGLSHVMNHFLHFVYIMRLTPFDFLEVKRSNSHIFMSYVDTRTWVYFNGSVDANYLEVEE